MEQFLGFNSKHDDQVQAGLLAQRNADNHRGVVLFDEFLRLASSTWAMPALPCALLVHLPHLDDGGTMAGDSQVLSGLENSLSFRGRMDGLDGYRVVSWFF